MPLSVSVLSASSALALFAAHAGLGLPMQTDHLAGQRGTDRDGDGDRDRQLLATRLCSELVLNFGSRLRSVVQCGALLVRYDLCNSKNPNTKYRNTEIPSYQVTELPSYQVTELPNFPVIKIHKGNTIQLASENCSGISLSLSLPLSLWLFSIRVRPFK